MDRVGSFFKTRRTRSDTSPRSLSARPRPLPERWDGCPGCSGVCPAGEVLGAVLLNPVPQFVRVDTARSIKFDRRESALEEFIHFDPAHAKDFGDLSHFEELLHFSGPSQYRSLLWVRFSSHDHVYFH